MGCVQKKDTWKYRRRVVYVTLTVIAFMVMYIIVSGQDSALTRDVAIALIGAAVAVIGSYVFGAMWEDRSARRLAAGKDEQ